MATGTELIDAVITVGSGRGFIIEVKGRRLVITAAHCLPYLPSGERGSYSDERVYDDLLGPLYHPSPSVYAQPVLIDPVADIAILGEPEHDDLRQEAEDYEALLADRPAFRVGKITEKCDAQVLTLDGQWVGCAVEPPDLEYSMGALWLRSSGVPIKSGMSGSPIVDSNSSAIGLISIGNGPNPLLTHTLPGWLLKLLDL